MYQGTYARSAYVAAAIGTFGAPGALCSTVVSPPVAFVFCTKPALAEGATLTLTVSVTFTGATGGETVFSAGFADNAAFVTQTMETAVSAQDVVPAQNPSFQAPYSGSGFSSGQG